MTDEIRRFLKEEVLTPETAAAVACVSPRTITRRILNGTLDGVRVSKNVTLILKSDVEPTDNTASFPL